MNTIRHLNTVIRRMEDSLLTSKNPYEIEEIQRCLQKKKIGTSENGTKRNESSKGPDLGLLFFAFQKLFISYNLFKSANSIY